MYKRQNEYSYDTYGDRLHDDVKSACRQGDTCYCVGVSCRVFCVQGEDAESGKLSRE